MAASASFPIRSVHESAHGHVHFKGSCSCMRMHTHRQAGQPAHRLRGGRAQHRRQKGRIVGAVAGASPQLHDNGQSSQEACTDDCHQSSLGKGHHRSRFTHLHTHTCMCACMYRYTRRCTHACSIPHGIPYGIPHGILLGIPMASHTASRTASRMASCMASRRAYRIACYAV